MLISKSNPIHRVTELIQTITSLTAKLEPIYAAIRVVDELVIGADVSVIEAHPHYGPIWKEKFKAEKELELLLMEIGMILEAHPIRKS